MGHIMPLCDGHHTTQGIWLACAVCNVGTQPVIRLTKEELSEALAWSTQTHCIVVKTCHNVHAARVLLPINLSASCVTDDRRISLSMNIFLASPNVIWEGIYRSCSGKWISSLEVCRSWRMMEQFWIEPKKKWSIHCIEIFSARFPSDPALRLPLCRHSGCTTAPFLLTLYFCLISTTARASLNIVLADITSIYSFQPTFTTFGLICFVKPS